MDYKKQLEKSIEEKNRRYKHNYHFLLSDEEKKKFENARKRLKFTKSELFRKIINKEFLFDVELNKFIEVFRNQENNINQIAYKLNSEVSIDEEFKNKTLRDLNEIKINQIKFINEVRKVK